MDKEEYTKYIENNEDIHRILEVTSSLNTVIEILITKGVCTTEEFNKIKQKYKNQMIDDSYAREKPEDLEAAKTINDFMSMFTGKGD